METSAEKTFSSLDKNLKDQTKAQIAVVKIQSTIREYFLRKGKFAESNNKNGEED